MYHQLLKQKFSREISSLCFRAHQFGNHHKKVKYLKSDNTPLIKIVANKKNTQICTNFKTNYFLMLLLLYKKKYLCDRLKTPKMASGHDWKVQKICNWNWKIRKQKQTEHWLLPGVDLATGLHRTSCHVPQPPSRLRHCRSRQRRALLHSNVRQRAVPQYRSDSEECLTFAMNDEKSKERHAHHDIKGIMASRQAKKFESASETSLLGHHCLSNL